MICRWSSPTHPESRHMTNDRDQGLKMVVLGKPKHPVLALVKVIYYIALQINHYARCPTHFGAVI